MPNLSVDTCSIDRLLTLLASREHMKAVMALPDGSNLYWSWRRAALEKVRATPVQTVSPFDSDFTALLTAYDLLHTLSRDTDLTPEEKAQLNRIKKHIHTRSIAAPVISTPPASPKGPPGATQKVTPTPIKTGPKR